jgi:hypothetical protein
MSVHIIHVEVGVSFVHTLASILGVGEFTKLYGNSKPAGFAMYIFVLRSSPQVTRLG